MVDEAKPHSFHCASEALVVGHAVRHCSSVLSVDQRWLQVLQLLAYIIHLLRILLKCNGFTRVQKAVVNQMGSRPPNSNHDLFWAQVWLWEVLWSLFSIQPQSWSSPVVV